MKLHGAPVSVGIWVGKTNMGYKIAVVGATGNVGRDFLLCVAEGDFPADEVVALSSVRSIGVVVSFGRDDVL